MDLQILERRPLGGGCRGVSRTTLKLLAFFLLITTVLLLLYCCFLHFVVSTTHPTCSVDSTTPPIIRLNDPTTLHYFTVLYYNLHI